VSALRNVALLVAGGIAASATSLALPAPSQAATCDSASGVTVVVDFHQLGGGVQTFCDAKGAGENGAKQFANAHHDLTWVHQEQGFVCQVDGLPADQPCLTTPPATDYWSVWWSDGKSGVWKYSSLGVTSLKVPEGGYVALSWQHGRGQAPPGVKATAHTPSSPTTSPTKAPTSAAPSSPRSSQPTQASSAPSISASAAPSATQPSSSHPKKRHRHTRPPRSAGSREHTGAKASSRADGPLVSSGGGGSGSGGAPGWLGPVAVVLLFGAGGTIALVRRKSNGGA
jgi:hypothetical protein